MPARDARYSLVGANSGGDLMYERTYAGTPERDYGSMTKEELQGLLKHMGLPVSGNKDELIERLQDSDG